MSESIAIEALGNATIILVTQNDTLRAEAARLRGGGK